MRTSCISLRAHSSRPVAHRQSLPIVCLAQPHRPNSQVKHIATRAAKSDTEVPSTTGDDEYCDPEDRRFVVDYPKFEKTDPTEGFFPVRQPGEWPPVGHHLHVAGAEAATETKEKEFDPLRDGPLRYLGYANELGEAFAAWLPPFGVPLSYAVAIGYVLTDTGDKTFKSYNAASKDLLNAPDVPKHVDRQRLVNVLTAERAIDTVVWQLLASVALPGYTIHTVVHIVHELLEMAGIHENSTAEHMAWVGAMAATVNLDASHFLGFAEKTIPTVCGLLAIPLIVHPLDNLVHAVLNYTLRPVMRKYITDNGGLDAGLDMCSEQCIKSDYPMLSGEYNNTQLLGMFASDVLNLKAEEGGNSNITRSRDSVEEEAFAGFKPSKKALELQARAEQMVDLGEAIHTNGATNGANGASKKAVEDAKA